MKKFSLFVLIATMLVGLTFSAFATTWHDVDVIGTGYTTLYEELSTENLFVEESLVNTGSVNFGKDAMVSGEWVEEFKLVEGIGSTSFFEKAVIGGYHNPSGEIVPTGYIVENISNNEEIDVDKSLVSLGDWSLLESKNIDASGVTSVDKYVGSWTTDQPWVTDAYAMVDFTAGSNSFFDSYYHVDEVDGTELVPTWGQAIYSANENPGRPNLAWGDIAVFSSELLTNEDLSYEEIAVINPGYFELEQDPSEPA